MINHVVIVSCIQQSDFVIYMHVSVLFKLGCCGSGGPLLDTEDAQQQLRTAAVVIIAST